MNIYDIKDFQADFDLLGNHLDYEQPAKYIVNSVQYDVSYPTPVLTPGQTFILGYTNDKDGIYQASTANPVILFDDFTGAFRWVDFPFKVKSSAVKMLKCHDNEEQLRYFYYAMQTLNFTPESHQRLWISTFSGFKIPIPDIEIQQEVVEILDKFHTYCNSLTDGLAGEIVLRKQQYEYYRDKLLDFKELV